MKPPQRRHRSSLIVLCSANPPLTAQPKRELLIGSECRCRLAQSGLLSMQHEDALPAGEVWSCWGRMLRLGDEQHVRDFMGRFFT